MDDPTFREEAGSDPGIETLVRSLSKTFQWTGLYGPGHPVLLPRLRALHGELMEQVLRAEGGILLLGIARDRILYRDRFLGDGNPLVSKLTETLYLRGVATVGFGRDTTPESLLALFRNLHETSGDAPGPGTGYPGITLSPVNYRELLSRRIVDPGDALPAGKEREERLWRILLTSDLAPGTEADRRILDELAESPELAEAVLRRAKQVGAQGPESAPGAAVSPEVLARLFRRIGGMLRGLPEDRRRDVIHSLESGLDESPGEDPDEANPLDLLLARTLSEELPDEEFLDLLGTVLSLEGKGSGRLQTVFGIVAGGREGYAGLREAAGERVRESLRAKDYYAVKTWEAVEKLLLSRSEREYLASDHAEFLEQLSRGRAPVSDLLARTTPEGPDPASSFSEREIRSRSLAVLLELLSREEAEEEWKDLLEEVGKALPNLANPDRVDLLRQALDGLSRLVEEDPPARGDAIRETLARFDFGTVADLGGAADPGAEASRHVADTLAAYGEFSIRPLLDRLLNEPSAARRRDLLRLIPRLGKEAVPEILSRMGEGAWYFLRNLCLLLGEIGDRRAVGALLAAAEHPDLRVKREAIQALGKTAAPEAVASLGRVLVEEGRFTVIREDSLRIDAASALYRIGGAEALAFLHRGAASRRPAVRDHCEGLLRSLRGGR